MKVYLLVSQSLDNHFMLSLLQDAFDRMASKVEDARSKWETESSEIQERNKQLLLEFGLNPLQI